MRRNQNRNNSDTIRGQISFQKILTFTSGLVTENLAPSLSQILTALNLVYRLYRFRRVTIECHPHETMDYGVMYAPAGTVGDPPAAFADIEGRYMQTVPLTISVPRTLTVPFEALRTDHEWFVTDNDAATDADIIGNFYFRDTSGSANSIIVKYTIEYEFKGAQESAMISMINRKFDSGKPTPIAMGSCTSVTTKQPPETKCGCSHCTQASQKA